MEEPAGPARFPQRAPATEGATPQSPDEPLAEATTRYQDLTLARRLRGNRASFGAAALRRGDAVSGTDAGSPAGTGDGEPGVQDRAGRRLTYLQRRALLALIAVLLLVASAYGAVRWGLVPPA